MEKSNLLFQLQQNKAKIRHHYSQSRDKYASYNRLDLHARNADDSLTSLEQLTQTILSFMPLFENPKTEESPIRKQSIQPPHVPQISKKLPVFKTIGQQKYYAVPPKREIQEVPRSRTPIGKSTSGEKTPKPVTANTMEKFDNQRRKVSFIMKQRQKENVVKVTRKYSQGVYQKKDEDLFGDEYQLLFG